MSDMTDMTDDPIRSQADLERAWRTLMGPLGFGGHSVWMMFLDADGRPFRQLTRIEDAEQVPGEREIAGLAHVLSHLTDDAAPLRVAFLLTRPGTDGVSERDRAVAAALYAAAVRGGMPAEVVHLANDVDVWPLPMDEVTLARPA